MSTPPGLRRAAAKAPASTDEPHDLDVLVHSTYAAIKRDILGNRLRPGSKLTHRMLAENLGVSRTPVRESLERLYQEGYVKRVQNRGYFVAEMDTQEVGELYQTREALELYALQRVLAKGISAQSLKAIQAINARYRILCQQNLSRERLLVDREFHLALADLTGNGFLSRTLAGIFDRLILKRRVEGYHDTRGLKPHDDHVRLLAALGKSDDVLAQRLLRDHISSACARLTEYLQASVA